MRGRGQRLAITAALIVGTFGAPAAAPAAFAPVDQPGPALSVPPADLAAARTCVGLPGSTSAGPILLIHGTTLTSQQFAWNYARSFQRAGRPYCTVDLPRRAMGDIQVAAEYVVDAIRALQSQTGRQVDVVGHSQGGMIGRWALRFWPDTRPLVDDLIGLAPSNHGTVDAQFACGARRCAESIWQQRPESNFMAALNSYQETFAPISYTNVYTRTDEVVTPNLTPLGSSSLRTGDGRITNVAIQDACPNDLAEHLGLGTYDNTGYALAIDALDHDGPASLVRVLGRPCAVPYQPGVDPVTAPARFAGVVAEAATTLATTPPVPAEPPLKPYTQSP